MVAPLNPSSFYTSRERLSRSKRVTSYSRRRAIAAYGTVLRLTNGFQISPDWPWNEDRGEWKSMGVSHFLLRALRPSPPLHRPGADR